MSNNNNKAAANNVTAKSEETKNFFQKLFGGKENEPKVETPEERASKVVAVYDLEAGVANKLVDKIADFERDNDLAQDKAKADTEAAAQAIKDAEEAKIQADAVVNATKAAALRMRTLALSIKNAEALAEKAQEEAKAKIEQLEKATEESKAQGQALLNGVTSPLFTLERMLEMSDEEVEELFGNPKQEPNKAPNLGGV